MRFLAVSAALALAAGSQWAAGAPQPAAAYPVLGSLGADDFVYAQQQDQLARSYAALKGGGRVPELVIYSYTPRAAVDLGSLAAKLNLPYETIATLNRLDRARPFVPGERVLASSVPGLFVPTAPGSDLDLLLSYRDPASGYPVSVSSGRGPENLVFIPGARFTPEERAVFLGSLFRFPLPSGALTSSFGLRPAPAARRVPARPGIELAAPAGAEVYAARSGKVVESGVDPVLGQYLAVVHEGGWSTVYGHLSRRIARLNDEVESGMIVGNVGSTGESAGPRLYFEVRTPGAARDPEPLAPQVKKMNRPLPATRPSSSTAAARDREGR